MAGLIKALQEFAESAAQEPAGAGTGEPQRRPTACSSCARMSRGRGSERGCIEAPYAGDESSAVNRYGVEVKAILSLGDIDAGSRIGVGRSARPSWPDRGARWTAGRESRSGRGESVVCDRSNRGLGRLGLA